MIQIDLKVEVDPLKFSAAIFPKCKQEVNVSTFYNIAYLQPLI